jgi:hypothetical protein
VSPEKGQKAGAPEPLVALDALGGLDVRQAALARLFRQARAGQPLDDLALGRVRARLRQRREMGAAGPGRLAAWRVRAPGLALGLALLAVACAAIASFATRARHPGARGGIPTAAPPSAPPTIDAPVKATSVSMVAPPAADLRPAAARGQSLRRMRTASAPGPAATRARKEPSGARAPAMGGALAEEARLLEVALASLRRGRDGEAALAALATLDRYQATFPEGLLRAEAARARIDALFILGRQGEAQAALDALALEPRGRDLELLVVRGELRARQDCRRAIGDFKSALSAVASGPLAERALYGLATCLYEQGDEAAAARASADYLRRFPGGRFAGAIESPRPQH